MGMIFNTIEPLPLGIYKQAKESGITKIEISMHGGYDESHYSVGLLRGDEYVSIYDGRAKEEEKSLHKAIEEWAWNAYSFNGAGCGDQYGDDVTYDIENKEASIEGWYDKTERHCAGCNAVDLEIEMGTAGDNKTSI